MARRKKRHEAVLCGEITSEWVQELAERLCTESKPNDELVLYLDSGGGDSKTAYAFLQFLEVKKLSLTVVVLSDCSSAAIMLFSYAKARYVAPFSSFLFHRMKASTPEDHTDLETAKDWVESSLLWETSLLEWEGAKLGEKGNKWLKEHSKTIAATEIVEAGLAKWLNEFVCKG